MDSRQHDQNAEDRFQERRAERAAQLDKAAKGIVDFTDMLRRDARRAILHPNDGQGLERILGVSDLLEVNFLDIGRRAGRAVGRQRPPQPGRFRVRGRRELQPADAGHVRHGAGPLFPDQ